MPSRPVPPPKRNPWDPKRQVLTPARKHQLLERIALDPSIIHYDANKKGYLSLHNSLRRSDFYGYQGLHDFLKRGLGVVPYKRRDKYFVPVKSTPASIRRFIHLRIKEGASPRATDWTHNPALRATYNHARELRFLGFGSWEKLVHAMTHSIPKQLREKIQHLIDTRPHIFSPTKDPGGYNRLTGILEKNNYFGYGGMQEFLEKEMGVVPYRRVGSFFVPTHPNAASVARFIQVRVRKGISSDATTWNKDPELRRIYEFARKKNFFGHGKWNAYVIWARNQRFTNG